jgi:HEAT repeat protein
VREAAALALGTLAYPPAAPLLRKILAGADPGMNLQSFCIDALGEVGTAEDIPLLKAVVAADPYHGEGIHVVRGRAALRKIKGRK